MPKPLQPLPGGYSYASRLGVVLQHPSGCQVYFQPGDDAASILETIEAIEEAAEGMSDLKAGAIADMSLGDYFDA